MQCQQPQFSPKNETNLKIVLTVLGFFGLSILFGQVACNQDFVKPYKEVASNQNVALALNNSNKLTANANKEVVLDSSIEFIPNISQEEKLRRIKILKTFPEFTKVSDAVQSIGFSGCTSYITKTIRSSPDTDSLTGFLFSCDKDYKSRLMVVSTV